MDHIRFNAAELTPEETRTLRQSLDAIGESAGTPRPFAEIARGAPVAGTDHRSSDRSRLGLATAVAAMLVVVVVAIAVVRGNGAENAAGSIPPASLDTVPEAATTPITTPETAVEVGDSLHSSTAQSTGAGPREANPVFTVPPSDVIEEAVILGPTSERAGCIYVDSTEGGFGLLLFSYGTSWNSVQRAVVNPDGTAVVIGVVTEASGGAHGVEILDLLADAQRATARECLTAAGTERVYVVGRVSRVQGPSEEATDDE